MGFGLRLESNLVRRAFPIIAALLAYLMVPGAVEIVENVAHWVTHGDAAHASEQHAKDSPDDEHGCSGTYHACSCHHAPIFAKVVGTLAPAAPSQRARVDHGFDTQANDSGYVTRLLRPPRLAA